MVRAPAVLAGSDREYTHSLNLIRIGYPDP